MKKKTILTLIGVGSVVCASLIGKYKKDETLRKNHKEMCKDLEKHVDEVCKPMDDAIERFGEAVDEMHVDIEKHKQWLEEHKSELD